MFDYNTDFGADVQAKYSGAAFTLGNNSPGTGGPTASGGNSTTSPRTGTPDSGNANAPSTNASTSSCSFSSGGLPTAGSGSAGASSSAASIGASPTTGSATLHVRFESGRQIVICSDGPFYLMAAYSSIQNGEPTGMVPTAARLMLSPATLPDNTVAENDREPKP